MELPWEEVTLTLTLTLTLTVKSNPTLTRTLTRTLTITLTLGETGVDCGGACAFCIPACDVPNSPDQTCQLPTLSQVSPASGPTGHATPI